MRLPRHLAVALAVALWLFQAGAAAQEAQPEQEQEAPRQEQEDLFPRGQIEQLVAPIALYPDALLAQILMAATYPLDIVQAVRWQQDHKDLEGDALQEAAEAEPWDQSVKTLVFFPSVLEYMNDNLDWTQDLGDAVLGQQDDVMESVQHLRAEAQQAGTLETTEWQRVETEGDIIVVQPADAEVVYVPSYDPSTAYGQSEPPATTYYPATYTTPVYETSSSTSDSSTGTSLLSFGAGALAGGLLTAAIMWDDDDDYRIYYGGRGYYGRAGYWGSPNYWRGDWRRPANIDIDRDVNIERGDININRERGDINVNRGIAGNGVRKWEHNPERRGGVRYRNKQTRQKFSRVNKATHIDRDVARGRDPARRKQANRQSPQRRDALKPKSVKARRPQSRPARVNAPKRNVKRAAATPKTRAAPQKRRPARRSGGRAGTFKVEPGRTTRAARKRGHASRGGRHARRGGGGRRRRG